MSTQAEFLKVNQHVIDPLIRHFGVEIDPDTVSDYVEDLRAYPEETLKSAMGKLRRECKRRPSMAQIIEACEIFKTTPAKPSQRREPPSSVYHPFGEEAKNVLRSDTGQLALRNEVGYDVWLTCWRDGKLDFTEGDIRRYVQHRLLALEALSLGENIGNPKLDHFRRLWGAMQERNSKLKNEFLMQGAAH